MLLEKRDIESFKAHDVEFQTRTVDSVREQHKEFTSNNIKYDADKPIGKILDTTKFDIAIDIGCGHGYFTNLMAQSIPKVYGIEPNETGIKVAQELYADVKHIEWKCAFAEDALSEIQLDKPTLFLTSTVLSHLEDKTVTEICKAIEAIAPVGSMICFSELWGMEHHESLWHCRGAGWWKEQFGNNWDFNFIENNVQVPYRYKSFTATKNRNS